MPYEAQMAETVNIRGHQNDLIDAYLARPSALVPIRGWWSSTTCPAGTRQPRRLPASLPTTAMSPSHRTCTTVRAKPRPRKIVPASVPPGACRMTAPWGMCRAPLVISVPCRISTAKWYHRLLFRGAASVFGSVYAVWDRRGHRLLRWGVVAPPAELTPRQPVAPIEYSKDLRCPLLGLFGREDRRPSPEDVARIEAELKRWGKTYEFHMYEDAGHSFFSVDRPSYRQEAAVEGWKQVFRWYEKYLR